MRCDGMMNGRSDEWAQQRTAASARARAGALAGRTAAAPSHTGSQGASYGLKEVYGEVWLRDVQHAFAI